MDYDKLFESEMERATGKPLTEMAKDAKRKADIKKLWAKLSKMNPDDVDYIAYMKKLSKLLNI